MTQNYGANWSYPLSKASKEKFDYVYSPDNKPTASAIGAASNTPMGTSDWNSNWQSGFYEGDGAANSPENKGGWFWGLKGGHSANSASYKYGLDIAIENASGISYIRSTQANGTGTWQKIYTSVHKPTESDIVGLDKYTQAEVDAQISLLSRDNPNNQTGTGYTLQLADQNKTVWRNNAGANTVTIPSNATIALPVNSLILVMMEGAGVTTVQAASGVTLNGVSAGSGVLERYIGVTLVKRGTNNWIATPLEVS